MNYYNEHDKRAAAWLRELIKAGLISNGVVDERDIQDVRADELTEYIQCHFFAGIGGWSYALRLAGWPDDRRVYTGSCPCQPFSDAGKGMAEADERHLWPDFRNLIGVCRPPVVFGEQVASPLGLEWLARVRLDLERAAYAFGGGDLCAAGVGAPHRRQRLFWVADAEHAERRAELETQRARQRWAGLGGSGGVGQPDGDRRNQGQPAAEAERHRSPPRPDGGASRGMGEPSQQGLEGHARDEQDGYKSGRQHEKPNRPASTSGRIDPWGKYDILDFEDGKKRRVEAGTFPLAHGIPGRVGLLRGYGNAVVPQVAAEFIAAYCEARGIVLTQ